MLDDTARRSRARSPRSSTIADATSLTAGLTDIDPEAVHRARTQIESGAGARARDVAARALRESLGDGGADVALGGAGASGGCAMSASRRLCRVDLQHLELARAQFVGAQNLTDRLAALGVLVSAGATDAQAALDAFAARYADDAMVLDKWFSVQATHAEPETLARVEALTTHPAFRWNTPNSVYALLVAFAHRNPRAFHRADGASYRFVADAVVAARCDQSAGRGAARHGIRSVAQLRAGAARADAP